MEFELPDYGGQRGGGERKRTKEYKGGEQEVFISHAEPAAGIRIKYLPRTPDSWSRNNPEDSNSSFWEAQLGKQPV